MEPLIVWPPWPGSGSPGRGKVPFEAHGAKSFPVTMETGTVGSQPENQREQRWFKHKIHTGSEKRRQEGLGWGAGSWVWQELSGSLVGKSGQWSWAGSRGFLFIPEAFFSLPSLPLGSYSAPHQISRAGPLAGLLAAGPGTRREVIKGTAMQPPPSSLLPAPPACPPGMRPCQGDPVEATGGGQGREAAFMSAFLLEETQSTAWMKTRRHATSRSELLPRMSLFLKQAMEKPLRLACLGCTWLTRSWAQKTRGHLTCCFRVLFHNCPLPTLKID